MTTTTTLALQVAELDRRAAELKTQAASLIAQAAALATEIDRLDFEAWKLECEIEKREAGGGSGMNMFTIIEVPQLSDLERWNEYLRREDIARAAWAAYDNEPNGERLRTYTLAFRAASEALNSYCVAPATTQGETR